MTEPVVYDFDPRNLPDTIKQAVGVIVAAAAQTESIVQDFIGAILKVDILEARALTTQMSGLLKDQVARSLARLNAPSLDELDKIDDLLDEVQLAFQRRNTVVHSPYGRHPDTGEVYTYCENGRGDLRIEMRRVSADDLVRDAMIIYTAGIRLMEFMMSRGIAPRDRTAPIIPQVDRRAKARARRQDQRARNKDAT